MSSTHCSYCHNRGHNRRTCPELKAKIESLPTDDYRVEQYKARQQGKPRNCKYCGQPGHNTRGCNKLKEESSRYADLNHFFKMDVANYLNSIGIVKGNCFSFNFDISTGRIFTNEDIPVYLGDSLQITAFLKIEEIRYNNYDLLQSLINRPCSKHIVTKVLSYSINNLPAGFEFTPEQLKNLKDYMEYTMFSRQSWENDTLFKTFYVPLSREIFNKYVKESSDRAETYGEYYQQTVNSYYSNTNIARYMSLEDSFDFNNNIEYREKAWYTQYHQLFKAFNKYDTGPRRNEQSLRRLKVID